MAIFRNPFKKRGQEEIKIKFEPAPPLIQGGEPESASPEPLTPEEKHLQEIAGTKPLGTGPVPPPEAGTAAPTAEEPATPEPIGQDLEQPAAPPDQDSYQGPWLEPPAEAAPAPEPEPIEGENPEDTPTEKAEEVDQRLNFINRLKQFFLNKKKALAEWGKKNFSKEGAKKAGQFLLTLLKNPYVIAAIIILGAIIVMTMACMSRQPGKTAKQTPNPNNPADQNIVLWNQALGGQKDAQRQLIIQQANTVKEALNQIATTDPAAQAKLDEIKKLLDEIMTLSDNDAAIRERINQINKLLDELKALLPNFASQIDAIKNQLNFIVTMLDLFKTTRLVINPKDMEYIRNFQVDRRIMQMLVYLVMPKDQNGAGHERIKVKRIFFSYDTERKAVSKETDYAENEEPNVSAHFSGQAADIVDIDYIKCTQIERRRLLSDKKTKLPPIPIKVAWQTEKGYAQAGGPDAYGQNMHQLFNNLGSGSVNEILLEQIADALGIDLDLNNLKGRSLAEIARYIGLAVLKETLDIPGGYELGNNLEEISGNIGRAYLAQALGVPLEGIQGNSPEEIEENIGRAILEEKMGLPAGSLSGNSSDEIFASAGRRKIEESLGLARATLEVPFSNQTELKRNIGQGRVEASLGIKPRTFYGSIEEFKSRAGKDMFDMTFANPEMIDNWLGIATGTTAKMIDGQISMADYNSQVGDQVYQTQILIYQDKTKRAEAFNLTLQESKDLFENGNPGVFVSIGKTTLSRTLALDNDEREMLRSWFDTHQKPPELDDDYMGGQYGLKNGDLGKIFIDDLGRSVFRRLGQVVVLDNLSQNSALSPYLAPLADIKFYTDRLVIIKDNFEALENSISDPATRQKAQETKNLVDQIIQNPATKDIPAQMRQIQVNLKFINEKAGGDERVKDRIRAIEKAVNEIIEGRPMSDFESFSTSGIKASTDPKTGLTKQDILNLLTGRRSLQDMIYIIGLRKWEIEFDLPDGALQNILPELQKNDFKNADEILLSGIGKARVEEYGGLGVRSSDQVDRDLGLAAGTTADFRAGKMSQNAYYIRVGMATAQTTIAARLLNPLLGLDDPNYTLTGTDITKLLNGGWFYVALKVGGNAIDEALGFPAGGTLDIIQQSEGPGDVLTLLAEKKLGLMAGLNHPVSLGGDIVFNLGRAKLEQELGLKFNGLDEGNVVEKIRNYTNSDSDRLGRLDAILGIVAGTSKNLLAGSVSGHDYIVKVGEHLKNIVLYDQIAQFAPTLQNKDLRDLALALAERTGSPEEILMAAGARQIGEILGLDYPVSIRGNFRDNLGEGKIEDRLGLKLDSFKGSIDDIVGTNGQDKFEAAFYIERGQLAQARQADSGYWTETRKNRAKLVDAILNIPGGKTEDFLTGRIDTGAYVAEVGQSTMAEVTIDKLSDLLDLEDKYRDAIKTTLKIFQDDPGLESSGSQQKIFNALLNMGGINLDNMTKFDPGTWNKIIFVDPNDPENTGPKNAQKIILEQGKKWLARWIGVGEEYEPYVDLVYEQLSGIQDKVAMLQAIKEATGLPTEDAQKFLDGDLKGGLTVWGVAQLVKMYNEEFGAQGFELNYNTVKAAYFNNPEAEKVIGDAAVAAEKQKVGSSLTPEHEQEVRQQAIREVRDNARQDVMYQAIDIQLHRIDANIPAGFTKTMREGTDSERWNLGIQYLGNLVHSNNPSIPAEFLPDLKRYFDPNSPDFHSASALSSTTFAFLDGQMKQWFGDFVQPGTAKALLTYAKTGDLGSPAQQGTLAQIYTDYGITVVTNWADKTMGLPMGSTKMIYDYYTKYQTAMETLKQAQTAYNAALAVGAGGEELGALANQILDAKTLVNALKYELITFVITTVFQKQLLAVDNALGLVPGSSAMLVGMFLIPGGLNPWTIGLFVLTNLFGVYRVDVVCTACGYYPALTPETIKNSLVCPLGEFDGKSESSFRTNSILAAQYKVGQLIGDLLAMPKKLNDDNLTPTQIMTMRQEDVDAYASQLNELYGPAATRYNSGLWANELMWDHIHVGY